MYFLIGISILLLLCISWLRKKKIGYFKIIAISSISLYLISILALQYFDYVDKQEFRKFDLNKNGKIDGNEYTYEYEQIELDIINNNGTNQFYLLGYPFCLVYSIIIVLIFHIITKILNFKP
ncbi:hypothetical protein [uncultured Flavobacterium sp.]|uniref:hypothetical protein n=1 Tax=uncultured Flavobacterium sp. TaxID=165435 RepID=UPI0025967B59|nr:hypothetical protein [uncultured Flavobacterium sp.]